MPSSHTDIDALVPGRHSRRRVFLRYAAIIIAHAGA
jgi:hypothetical protein